MRRTHPRPLSGALERVTARLEPASTIARVQGAWPQAAGETVAEEAEPASERGGVVTIACRSAVWAQELALLETDLAGRLNEALGAPAERPVVRSLRFVVRGAGRAG